MRAAAFQPGMEVYGADGIKIGHVVEVWAWVDGYGYLAKSYRELADYGPIKGTGEWLGASGDGLLHVVRNQYLEEREERFIPFAAARRLQEGRITLGLDASEWDSLYDSILLAA